MTSGRAIVERLGAYQELGVRHLALGMSTPSHAATFASLEVLAHRIRPQLKG